MPELPEVHTTVEGLKKTIVRKTIKEVWSDFYIGTSRGESQTIKNKKYFDKFKKEVEGAKIKSVERRGKNILINLDSKNTIIVHMKMTGHLMVGKYAFQNYIPSLSTDKSLLAFSSARPVGLRKARSGSNFEKQKNNVDEVTVPPPLIKGRGLGGGVWTPLDKGPLQDPYNKYIHLVFSLSNGKQLVLSDMRKFASVSICKTVDINLHDRVGELGPDPFDPKLTPKKFFEILIAKKNTPIKSALLDQSTISGIGNIYSDEILWETGVHPLSPASKIPRKKYDEIFKSMRKILKLSIEHGGDSKSDYRNVFGERGGFQNFHKVYGKKNQKCPKKNCSGIICRMVVKGRSAHFCPKHQIKYER